MAQKMYSQRLLQDRLEVVVSNFGKHLSETIAKSNANNSYFIHKTNTIMGPSIGDAIVPIACTVGRWRFSNYMPIQ